MQGKNADIKRSNGDMYVYERITKYNLKKQYNETTSSHLIGKTPAGREEVVPTRKRRKDSLSVHTVVAKRVWCYRHPGMDWP